MPGALTAQLGLGPRWGHSLTPKARFQYGQNRSGMAKVAESQMVGRTVKTNLVPFGNHGNTDPANAFDFDINGHARFDGPRTY